MDEKGLAYFKVIAAMVIVGSSVVVGKIMVQHIPIFLASELRFLVASIIFIPLLMIKEGIPSLDKKDFVILFLQSLTGVFLFSLFMLYGLKFTTAMEAGIITSTLPAMVALLAFFLLKEKLTRNKMIGVLFAILGILILNTSGVFTEVRVGPLELLGNLLILGAVMGEALFIILGKSITNKVSPLAISTGVSVIGVLLFFPMAIYEWTTSHYSFGTVNDWLLILYFGIVVTVFAFLLMYHGLEKLPASTVGILTSVLPLSTVILSFIFLKESLHPNHLIGSFLIMIAIYFTSTEENSKRNKELKLVKSK